MRFSFLRLIQLRIDIFKNASFHFHNKTGSRRYQSCNQISFTWRVQILRIFTERRLYETYIFTIWFLFITLLSISFRKSILKITSLHSIVSPRFTWSMMMWFHLFLSFEEFHDDQITIVPGEFWERYELSLKLAFSTISIERIDYGEEGPIRHSETSFSRKR